MKTANTLVRIPVDAGEIVGELKLPDSPLGLVLFAHGSGSSRHSPRNNYVAQVLNDNSLATLLMDLLTPEEDLNYETRFDIELLTTRLLSASQWAVANASTRGLPIGFFGASTGAAAALQGAARDKAITVVVSRGGRPDLAGAELGQVTVPVLLLVGSNDFGVIELNEQAFARLNGPKEMVLVPGATHLFEEPGTLDQVADQAAAWFKQHCKNK